jgi:uncharacterized metal-binding protein YceD (DUF177 family)
VVLAAQTPEFSRRVLLSRVGPQLYRQDIEATAGECAALARRFGLVSLDRLAARIELAPRGRDMFLLRAVFDAAFAQECVVTLDPVPGAVALEFELLYGPAEVEEAAAGMVDDNIAFEPLDGDAIDVGEAVAQEFSLALPEFPRAPGADLAAEMPSAEDEAGAFAGLLRSREQDTR